MNVKFTEALVVNRMLEDRRGTPSLVTGALIIRPRAMSTPFGSKDEVPTASRTCTLTDQTGGDDGRTKPEATAD